MKRSNRILFIVLSCVFAAILIIGVIFRVSVAYIEHTPNYNLATCDTYVMHGHCQPLSFNTTTMSPDLKNFNQMSFNGRWDVRIIQGKNYSIKITAASENFLRHISITKDGDTVYFKMHRANGNSPAAYAVIQLQLPTQKKLTVSTHGMVKTLMENIHVENLELHASGITSMQIVGNKIGNLKIESSGMADIDLNQLPTQNAEVHLSGISNVQLNMTGGILNGDISGMSHIHYQGNTSKIEVDTSGRSSVIKE
ncbi:MAG: hypothetical protein A2298_03215 [Gammaproteobacteria bacterium RIFOXYB2_FULL_38_6]|nr:MAG: hypothetical protein A2298_03215 [Gammaproteobacteria bacterium RIFOXYB2_FULL_38_6]